MPRFHNHLRGSRDLVTTYEATRAGFVALALEPFAAVITARLAG